MALVGLMYSSTPQCTSKPQPLRHVGKQFTSYGSCSFDHHWSAPTSDPRRTLKPWTAHYVVHAMCTSWPPQLKKDQNTNLCILSNIYVVLRFWECAFLLCGFHRSLFRNISSQFGRLLCWSATSCELHPIPLLWKCQGRFNKKGVGSNVQRLFCSIPTQLPPPMQWLLVDGFVDS